MPNEKMMILNMLQDGKISADEAAKLLSSVEEKESGASQAQSRPAASGRLDSGSKPPRPSGAADSGPRSNNGGRAASPRTSGVDFDELGRKFAAFARDLEPKFQKATEIVAETTVNIADKLSRTFESTIESAASHRSPADPSKTERHIELAVDTGYNELSLQGLNGTVHIKGYNGDKISAHIRYKESRRNASINLMKLGNKYYLNYEEDEFRSVEIDAYVPSHKFNVVKIGGLNGNMEIAGLSCEQIEISNSNGQVILTDLTADSIKSESSNGRLTISDINAKQGVFEHFNGVLEAGDMDVEKLSLTNFNGSLTMNVANFNRFAEYLWSVETSNAKLTMNVPTLPTLGYHIRAHATLGNIKLGLTGLEFVINDPTQVEARSASFEGRDKKVRLALETSNASLTVN